MIMKASLELSTNVRRTGDIFVAECHEIGISETGSTEEEARQKLMMKAERLLLSSMVENTMLT
jgi:hypothetical protein